MFGESLMGNKDTNVQRDLDEDQMYGVGAAVMGTQM